MASAAAIRGAPLGELSPVALVHVDKRRRIVGANAATEVLLKVSKRTLVGSPLSEVIYHDSPLFELLDRSARQAGDILAPATPLKGPGLLRGLVVDATIRGLDDGGFMLALSESVVREGTDTGAGVAGFGRILGHEVKNPLGGILGAAQLLQRQQVGDQAELLEIIISEARRIERLVNRLTAFELFSAPRLERFNIHAVLDQVIAAESVAVRSKVRVERAFDPSLPHVLGDSDHLQQAFQNLVRNAVEAVSASGQGGRVIVRTAYAAGLSMKKARLGSGLRRAMLVSIEDDGVGIPRDLQPSIFEVFQSSKSGARGLGLSIVNEVITAHGGQVRVESEPGRTCFAVLLPLGDGESSGE